MEARPLLRRPSLNLTYVIVLFEALFNTILK